MYLVNDPEDYDKQGNSNRKSNVDGQDQRVECCIPLQAGTQYGRESGHSKSSCGRSPSSKGHNYWQGWQDKSHDHHRNVDILYAVCSFKRSSMKREPYLPKQGHHVTEPPHCKLEQCIVDHYSCRGGGKYGVNWQGRILQMKRQIFIPLLSHTDTCTHVKIIR